MITYKVKARLAKGIGTDNFQLEEFERNFKDVSQPINARREALNYYFSIIDIIGGEGDDLEKIREHIANIPSQSTKLTDKLFIAFMNNIGVGLYCVLDEDEEVYKINSEFHSKYPILGEEIQNEYLIIGYDPNYDYLSTAWSLENEIEIYEDHNWGKDDWISKIKYLDPEADEEIVNSTVLWTPFDFWAYSNRGKNKEIEEPSTIKEISTFEKIIKAGENRKVEFKSTLRYCLKSDKPQEYIEHSITKTIAAFANTEGGLLFIGVDDEGEVLGLGNDISSFRKKSEDDFLKHFDNLIHAHFTTPIDALLQYNFELINGKKVFYVIVSKSSKPRILKTKSKGKEFLIRRAASTYPLDIEEAINYAKDKWYA